MRKTFSYLLLVFCYFTGYSQKSYSFPQNFSTYYNFYPDEAYEHLKKLTVKNSDKDIDNYAVDYIYGEQYDFDANKIYLDWPEFELYLLKILNTLYPSNVDKKKMDVFIERTIERNAAASGFGNIYFNLGFIAEAEDESFLASIMGHEAAHILFGHRDKRLLFKQQIRSNLNVTSEEAMAYWKLCQKQESQADSFALETLKKLSLNSESLLNYKDDIDLKKKVLSASVPFSKLIKTSNLDPKEFQKKKQKDKKPYSSHPATIERIEMVKNAKEKCINCTKKFFIDSALFIKFKKAAIEDSKKILFESNDFDKCIRICFKEYLSNSKNIKNLFYLIESIRRCLYIDPKLASTGFLTQDIEDSDLYYDNKSILWKPDYIFDNYKEYLSLKDHPFFTKNQKPFNTYREAFLFFSKEALKLNFNEANLSIGLFYYATGKKDSSGFFLNKYIQTGPGLQTEFVTEFLKEMKPSIPKGKVLILYDNTGNYNSGFHNYYLTKKRKNFNPEIRDFFGKDSLTSQLIIMNELYGSKPFKLYEMQKLSRCITSLYNEDDIEMCKKIRLKSNYSQEQKEISNVFKKHILVFAPEWYNWLKERNMEKIFYVDILSNYRGVTDELESSNTYTGHYLNMNDSRPYFKDAVRIGGHIKQKENEICKDLYSFLYE